MPLTAPPAAPPAAPTAALRSQSPDAFTANAEANVAWEVNSLYPFEVSLVGWYGTYAKPELEALQADVSAKQIATSAAAAAATSAATVAGSANLLALNAAPAVNAAPVKGQDMTFTYNEANRTPYPGMYINGASTANVQTNNFLMRVSTWNAGTKVVVGTVIDVGSLPAVAADWQISLGGPPGPGATLQTAKVTVAASGTVLVKANAGAPVVATAASAVTLDRAALLQSGWAVFFPQQGTSYAITLNTSNAELIQGFGSAGTSKVVPAGSPTILLCDGVGFTLIPLSAYADSEVYVYGGNGFGSTNTLIRRFTTTKRNVGAAITYADSATLGASLTINEGGLYLISYQDGVSALWRAGVSVNTTQPNTSVSSIAESEVVFYPLFYTGFAILARFAAGDVVRPHSEGTGSAPIGNSVRFAIRKVGA